MLRVVRRAASAPALRTAGRAGRRAAGEKLVRRDAARADRGLRRSGRRGRRGADVARGRVRRAGGRVAADRRTHRLGDRCGGQACRATAGDRESGADVADRNRRGRPARRHRSRRSPAEGSRLAGADLRAHGDDRAAALAGSGAEQPAGDVHQLRRPADPTGRTADAAVREPPRDADRPRRQRQDPAGRSDPRRSWRIAGRTASGGSTSPRSPRASRSRRRSRPRSAYWSRPAIAPAC